MALSREDILSRRTLPVEEVPVPEWGGSVFVKTLTARERDQYEASILHGKGANREVRLEGARVRLVILATVDENGQRLFGEGDVEALSTSASSAVNRIYEKAARLAGILDSDIEELVQDFTTDQNEPSSLD